jgi:xenotropic and polytropic retrovirus receptor 1
MKFGKTLRRSLIPEWKRKFIDYKGLKKLIKRLRLSYKAFLSQPLQTITTVPTGDLSLVSDGLEPILPTADGRSISMTTLSHRRTTDSGIIGQSDGSNGTQDRPNPIGAASASLSPTPFIPLSHGSFQNIMSVKVVQHGEDKLRKRFRLMRKQGEKFDRVFMIALEEELHKISDFFENRMENVEKNWTKLRKQLLRAQREPNIAKLYGKKLRKASLELYRGLQMVSLYASLNTTGLFKVLKKYDKYLDRMLSVSFSEIVQNLSFAKIDRLSEIGKDLKRMYGLLFTSGDASKTAEALRIDEWTQKQKQKRTTHSIFFGFFLGISLVISGAILWDLVFRFPSSAATLSWPYHIFEGLGFILTMGWFLCGNVLIFWRTQINYVFIFQFDQKKHESVFEYGEAMSFLTALFLTFVFAFLRTVLDEEAGVPVLMESFWYPIIMSGLFFVIVLVPHPFFFASSRIWLLKVIGRILLAPFFRVRFADFFFADIMTSITRFLFDLQYIIFLSSRDGRPSPYLLLINSFPYYARFMQCLRRFYDTHDAHPHLTNALKYFSGILASFCSLMDVMGDETIDWRLAWFIVSVGSTTFKLLWDYLMDAGFFTRDTFHKTKPFLRSELMYESTAFYYVSIVLNFLFRWAWLPVYFAISSSVGFSFWIFFLAFIEVFRRGLWNVFRVEYEFVGNCGAFRAVREVPLLFDVDTSVDILGEDDSGDHLGKEDVESGGNPESDLESDSDMSNTSQLGMDEHTL